jgi:hypothetical protein
LSREEEKEKIAFERGNFAKDCRGYINGDYLEKIED